MWIVSVEKRFVNASSVDAVVVNVDSSNFLRSPAETCNHRPSKRADGLGVGLGSALSVLQKGWWSSVSWYSVAAHVCSCALSVASTRVRGRECEKARVLRDAAESGWQRYTWLSTVPQVRPGNRLSLIDRISRRLSLNCDVLAKRSLSSSYTLSQSVKSARIHPPRPYSRFKLRPGIALHCSAPYQESMNSQVKVRYVRSVY